MASKEKTTTTTVPASNVSLRKGWRMVRFDEFAQMITERVDPSDTDADIYVGLEHLDPDSLKLRRWGTPSDVIGDKLQFRTGDIIFGRRRAYQRKLAVAEFDGICSAHAMVVRANTEAVDPEFLPFLMQSDLFMQRAIEISVGSLSPTINWKTLRIQEFPLPPKEEQRRIAEILCAADEACEGVQSSFKDMLQFREKYTEAALEDRLEDENSGSKNGQTAWPQEYLAEHVDLASGQVDPRKEPYCDMILVAPNHIEPGTGRLLERVTAKEQHAISGKYEFAAGDVVYSKIRPNLRKVILTDAPGLCSADMYPMRAKQSLNARYLLMLLLGKQFSAFAESESVRTGIPKLNRQSFSSYRCLLPPRQEQDEIMERIVEIDNGVALIRTHLERLRQLKRELMSHLLFGGLDV